MPNGIRNKRSFLDVAYDGAFSAYATIEKRPVAFREAGCTNASWPKDDYGVGSAATVVAVSPFGLL